MTPNPYEEWDKLRERFQEEAKLRQLILPRPAPRIRHVWRDEDDWLFDASYRAWMTARHEQ